MNKAAFDKCDVRSAPLVEWARASVSSSFTISNLTIGTHYFVCSVGGHCLAGMKVRVEVRAKGLLPPLQRALRASCVDGQTIGASDENRAVCNFLYDRENTPTIEAFTVSIHMRIYDINRIWNFHIQYIDLA